MNLSTQQPALGQDVFVAPSASVIGNVSLGAKASVWYGVVLKGTYVQGVHPFGPAMYTDSQAACRHR